MDTEFLKWLSTLGVGGAIAGFMFLFYRRDVKAYTELWRGQSDQLIAVVKENTAASVKTGALVEAMHKRIDRRGWNGGNGGNGE